MRPLDCRCYSLSIPFTRSFAHASATRNTTETVLVRATGPDGTEGFGEGCPREYVTGESVHTALDFFNRHKTKLAHLDSVAAMQEFIRANSGDIDRNPAAWCSIEIALLDRLAQSQSVGMEALLGTAIRANDHRYSAVLGDGPAETFHKLFNYYDSLGFTDFKIKLNRDPDRNREKIDILKAHSHRITVRADANNLWTEPSMAIEALSQLSFPFIALEEPIASRDFSGLSLIAAETGTRIVLDESLLRTDQVTALEAQPQYWIVNARLSKYGGLLRSLKLIDLLVQREIGIVIGTHVGETSLLTRAAWLLADAAGEQLLAMEGGFSTHLLAVDPFEPNLKLGRAGKLDPALYACRDLPGLGMHLAHDLESEAWATRLA